MTDEKEKIRAAARSKVYRFLALTFAAPGAVTLRLIKDALPNVAAALAVLEDEEGLAALAAVRRTLGALRDGDLEKAHLRCFGHTVSGDCPPYEGEYGQANIFQKTQSLADISGFYTAFGLELAPGLHERWDHMSVELEFMHFLATKETYAVAKGHGEERLALVREAQAKFLEEHLGRWTPAFVARLEAKAGDGPYAALARLLRSFLTKEIRAHGVDPESADITRDMASLAEIAEACEGCPARPFGITVEQGGR